MKSVSKKKSNKAVSAKKKTATKKRAAKKPAAATKSVQSQESGARKTRSADVAADSQSPEKTLKLRSVMVVNEANTIHAGLLRFLSDDSDIIIDASSVEMVDTAILQLIVAFVKQLENNNRKVKWKDPSDEFCARATLLGLNNELGIEEVCG